MESYRRLLLANEAWVQDRLRLRADYFSSLAKDQTPEFFWIGCSDSRVPAEEITGTQPGELFVHRNVANLVVHTDLNLLSVLQYAVANLKVSHVIVCGHYGCGGVRASTQHAQLGLLNKWLWSIKDVYQRHRFELDAEKDETARLNRLVEHNVVEQVQNLTRTSIVQEAWHMTGKPTLHGWVYDMGTGRIRELIKVEPGSEIEAIYQYKEYQGGAPRS
ncbi:MAG: carbonic anhydrase [Proteobacteria bacterium]|nr:carbonic anhydrase [Pseudomonadota bacterium]